MPLQQHFLRFCLCYKLQLKRKPHAPTEVVCAAEVVCGAARTTESSCDDVGDMFPHRISMTLKT